MGGALEEYVKDLFAGTVGEKDEKLRNRKLSEVFSYLGNQNNPPDSIVRGQDAIEVKKIMNNDAALALNSSYPKSKLYSNSPMISNACKNCEDWTVKDMIYIVGVVHGEKLKSLCMVYGEDYCADMETYEKVKNVIKSGVEGIDGVEFAPTRELGRVNRIDPLGITYLRVRGMWGIENPFNVFNYIYTRDRNSDFNFMAIINEDNYQQLHNSHKLEDMCQHINGLDVENVEIKDPNNPANLKKARLITFFYKEKC